VSARKQVLAKAGQYSTPSEIAHFVLRLVNPKHSDRVIDPACGAGDLLIAAKLVAAEFDGRSTLSELRGVDVDAGMARACKKAMTMRGWGAAITCDDSLLGFRKHESKYTLAICNPPWGSRLLERRSSVLRFFSLGTTAYRGRRKPKGSVEIGLLFTELCLRTIVPGGRAAMILPNGYLGNRSERYVEFRRWLMTHARVVAVIGFPRFVFKRSGADVSASAVVFERRPQPLQELLLCERYPIYCALVNRVGWTLEGRGERPLYRRDEHGRIERDCKGEPVVDSDLNEVIGTLSSSGAAKDFPWLRVRKATLQQNRTTTAADVIGRTDLSLDPKRWCEKHVRVRNAVRSVAHFQLGSVLRPVFRVLRRQPRAAYRYVEIDRIHETIGVYEWSECRGWALPTRGRLVAAVGDLFVANVWASAGKWMIAGEDARDGHLIVTTGCTHFELIPGRENSLVDLVFGLCSEAFRVQVRALATGSDGLSSVATDDMQSIVLPRTRSAQVRESIERRLAQARSGLPSLQRLVDADLAAVVPAANTFAPRTSHAAQV
jgi:type I restriction enzyme M protein